MKAQEKALLQVLLAVREVVAAAGPLGCPAGTVYAALMAQGCTLSQYQQIEGVLIRTGAVTKKGDLLFVGLSPRCQFCGSSGHPHPTCPKCAHTETKAKA